MAIVFKDAKIERKPIIKDAESGSPTTFWFETTPALRRQVLLNQIGSGTTEFGIYVNDVFRKALVAWEGLKDENGADIPYSECVRDAIVKHTETFTANDALEIFGISEQEADHTKKKHSTLKKR